MPDSQGFGAYPAIIKNVDINYYDNRKVDITLEDRKGSKFYGVRVVDPFVDTNGSGICFIPKKDSLCLVVFFEGEPFVVGFRRLVDFKSGSVKQTQERGTEEKGYHDTYFPGDIIFDTDYGNKIVIYSSGAIKIESDPICSTLYLPEKHIISTKAATWELETFAGSMKYTTHYEKDLVNNDAGKTGWETTMSQTVKQHSADTDLAMDLVVGSVDEKKEYVYFQTFPNCEVSVKKDGKHTIMFTNGSQIAYDPSAGTYVISTSEGNLFFMGENSVNIIKNGSNGPEFSFSMGKNIEEPDQSGVALSDFINGIHFNMNKDGVELQDQSSGGGNRMVMGKNGITFTTKGAFQIYSKHFNGAWDTCALGGGADMQGGNIVTSGPFGTHPIDLFTGLPIGGLGGARAG